MLLDAAFYNQLALFFGVFSLVMFILAWRNK